MAVKLLFVHALTAIHPGTGQGVGTIDLPIARERATNLPVIPGSTLKGCIRASAPAESRDRRFGTTDKQGEERFSDARLLLLPVRAAATTFVWATCPYVLRRFQRDCDVIGAAKVPREVPGPGPDDADVADAAAAAMVSGRAKLVLEDLDFDVKPKHARTWATWVGERLFGAQTEWRREFERRFVVLNDAAFDYLCEFATEVNAHIRIGTDGVVEDGALWYEESLPAETVMVALIEGDGVHAALPQTLRIGGNETTGQGLARLVTAGGAA